MREIPREQWIAFFDSFSRQHDHWLNTLELSDSGAGAPCLEWRELPLIGITADASEGKEAAISVLVGGHYDDHLAHLIRAPVRVCLKETAEGAHEALRIDSKDGATAWLSFRSLVLPEAVDGLP